MKLAISLATRGRADQCVRTIEKSRDNWTNKDTVLYVQADADDIETCDAIHKAFAFSHNVVLNPAPREDTIAAKWNRVMTSDADVFLVAADDDPYITPGYDDKILEAAKVFPDGMGMVYGHLANLSFSGAIAGTKAWCAHLGYLQPEYFPYWFCDHWTDDLARITGRISFADIRTDQSKAGKTQEMREPGWWATFFDACYLKRRDEAVGLLEKMSMPDWQRDLSYRNHPLVEMRSRGVNESVRQQSKQLESWSGLKTNDERYTRLKNKAIEMVPGLVADPRMNKLERKFFTEYLTPPTVAPSLARAF